ncbi:MAG: hypothetical protein E6Q97_21950 [Desulfurellales bacterium]|nr:MAG: hypothetical protein E6Q97_21950 [Desulfurellales bacterium]
MPWSQGQGTLQSNLRALCLTCRRF